MNNHIVINLLEEITFWNTGTTLFRYWHLL